MKPSLIRALNALGPWRTILVILAMTLAAAWLGIAVMFGVIPVGPGLTNRLGGIGAGDFMFFYPAGVLAAQGEAAAVYDPQRLTEVGRDRLGPKIPELVWPYPPTISLPLAILGKFSAGPAFALWVTIAVLALLVHARIALGSWRLAPVVFLFPGSALALFTGQFTPVLALLLGLFFLYGAHRPAIGGLGLGLLVFKPHFGVIPGVFALFARWGRAIIAAVVVGVVVVTASVVAFGFDTWVTFFQQGVRHSGVLLVEAPLTRFVSVFAAAYTSGLSIPVALALHFLAALAVGIAGLAMFARAARPSLRALGLTGATLQISPYVLDYDLVFLALPWLLMIRECREDSRAARPLFWPWLALTCLVPPAYMIPLYTGKSIGGPFLLLILLTAYIRNRRLTQRNGLSR